MDKNSPSRPASGQPDGQEHSWLTGGAPKRPRSPAARQIDALIDQADRVRQLSTLELHRFTSEIGIQDSLPLLELARPEQVRDLVDLQVWHRDRIDGDELLDWLSSVASLDPEIAAKHLAALDAELLGFLLRSRTNIYLSNDDLPDASEGVYYSTPDGYFVLDVLGQTEARNEQLIAIIETMYADDHEQARRLLANAMWELPSDLEEWSLRWRQGRMEDLGFTDSLHAMQIYAYLDPATVTVDESTADQHLKADPEPQPTADLALMLPPDGDSFWARSIAQLHDEAERQRVASALLALSNLNLSADRVDPADREHGQQSLSHLQARLSLGLEHLCEGDVSRAPKVLAQVALMRVARLGHSLVLDRQRRVLPALREGLLGQPPRGMDYLDNPLRQQLTALMASRPMLVSPEGASMPLSARAQLAQADELIATALLTAELVPPPVRPNPMPPGLTLPALFCTEVVNRVQGNPTGALDRGAVAALIEQIATQHFAEPAAAAAQRLAIQRLDRPLDTATRTLLQTWLDALARGLERLDPRTFDMRYLSEVQVQPSE